MSGLILFIVAVALLGVAIYSLVSYLKERRASQLPVHKKEIIPSVPHRFLLISLPSCTVPYRSQTKAGLRACLRSVYASEPMTPQACSALAASNCGGGLRKRRVR